MVGMVLYVIVHKFVMSIDIGGGGKDGKVHVTGVLENKLGPTAHKEGIDMLSMAVSMVVIIFLVWSSLANHSTSIGRWS